MPRKSKPWAVIVSTPDGPTRTEHTSQAKAYEYGFAERDAILAGTSPDNKIHIEQWDQLTNRWHLYEDIHIAI
ncbi:hypothetical protein ACFXI0_07880 [Kitasatospora indigofera]|uniref:hypothetical protein n=1 Tax=Kitasatospora indigofera TaxID=67307 RepID=UPI00368ADD89